LLIVNHPQKLFLHWHNHTVKPAHQTEQDLKEKKKIRKMEALLPQGEEKSMD